MAKFHSFLVVMCVHFPQFFFISGKESPIPCNHFPLLRILRVTIKIYDSYSIPQCVRSSYLHNGIVPCIYLVWKQFCWPVVKSENRERGTLSVVCYPSFLAFPYAVWRQYTINTPPPTITTSFNSTPRIPRGGVLFSSGTAHRRRLFFENNQTNKTTPVYQF